MWRASAGAKDTDAGDLGVMDIDEFAHAVSIIHGGAPFGDFDLAPGPMRIEGDEEIDGAVAAALDVSRGTEKSFRPLQRVGVDTAGQHFAG